MEFRVIPSNERVPYAGKDLVYLQADNWNDYSFVTMFDLYLFDDQGDKYTIGKTKIGFLGQTEEQTTLSKLPKTFTGLSSDYFSVGQDFEFYEEIAKLPNDIGRKVLQVLNDIVLSPETIEQINDEVVFHTSLLRSVSLSLIKGQFRRGLERGKRHSSFDFRFEQGGPNFPSPLSMDFTVFVESKPHTNIHAIIGRNGVGKTTLLNDMISVLTNHSNVKSRFIDQKENDTEIDDEYFHALVSVSFSAFDPFKPPKERSKKSKDDPPSYYYVGLKDENGGHLDDAGLKAKTIEALVSCFSNERKTQSWLKVIRILGLDEQFASKNAESLLDTYNSCREKKRLSANFSAHNFRDMFGKAIKNIWSDMSSGHAIVLLTMSRLVATVEEKTLVLLDEPEGHLHPPLLSAFLRALSELLQGQNGVGIIATHSPVVLQELPRSCVWKIFRTGEEFSSSRPKIETFGENVGVLTNEVFGLELERSGFHDLLASSVVEGLNYSQVLDSYNGQIGFEGRAILKAMIADRDRDH